MLARWIEALSSAGPAGYFWFGLLYALSTPLLVPGILFMLAAGYLWGPVIGFAIVSPSSLAGASLSFVTGRSFLASAVERWINVDPRLRAVDTAIRRRGISVVILLRLSPFLPYNLLNYALALTSVRSRDYVLGSWIGMMPLGLLYVYVGSTLPEAELVFTGVARPGESSARLLYWGGLLATLTASVILVKEARRSLSELLADDSDRWIGDCKYEGMASAERTMSHEDIRKWVESRGGIPTVVKGTSGLLRIDFIEGAKSEGRSDSLREVSWDEWFRLFDENDLVFLHSPEEDSKFFKLVASNDDKK
ncbi:MAG: TVP38/TMEM64 family protein [Myxococcales bacterium]|nr:TVP38/TMEM64 family protein [Myxococcales bacterium]